VNSPQLVAEFESELQRLVSLECWSVKGGKPTGSMVTFEFGRKILRNNPIGNPNLTDDERNYTGEVGLFTYFCPWRIEHGDDIISSWNDDNSKEGPMLRALYRLLDETVERVELLRPGLDLNLYFTGNLVLRLFCDQIDEEEGADNYIYFAPSKSYAVGIRSEIKVELRDWEDT
jgi:hypothetical protein